VLTTACVLLHVQVSETRAPSQRTPTDIVHLLNSVMQAELLILLYDFIAEAHLFDVQIIKLLAAIVLSALDHLNLT